MISSGEVSQMMMAQQSMFAQQASFAESIGPRMSGMDANAVFSGAQRHVQHSPVSSHAIPPVSYAQSGLTGYGAGNRLGNMAIGGMSAAASVGGMALGFSGLMAGRAGVLGALGTAGMHAFDPFGAAIAGYGGAGAGALMGGGIAGAALSAAGPLALMYAGSKAADAYFGGARQQSMIDTTLSQNFGFINNRSRTGVGFNRQQSYEIGTGMRHMAHDANMLTSVEELSSLVAPLRQTGAFSGVKDVKDFQKRFSESITTLREISKVIGSTMSEAMELFAHSRRVGFLGKTDQMKNMMNVQYTAATTGMSNGQVMQMQSAGADMATQMGFRRSTGAAAVTNIAQRLGRSVQAGAIGDDEIQDITGLAGAEGQAALAQRFTGMAYQMGMGTSVGRLAMAGLANFDKEGRFAGMNKDLARRFQEGSISVESLKAIGRRNMASKKNQVGFTARQEEIAGQFAASGGLEGVAKLMENIASERYGGMGDEAVTLLGKKFNIGAAEMDILRKMGAGGGIMADLDKSEFAKGQMSRSAYNEQTDIGKSYEKLKTKIGSKLFGGLEEAGAKMRKDITAAFESFLDDTMGRHVTHISEQTRETMEKAFAGDSQAVADLQNAAEALGQGMQSGLGQSKGLATSLVRGAARTFLSASFLGPASMFSKDARGLLEAGVDQAEQYARPITSEINEFSARSGFLGIGRSEYGQARSMTEMLDLGEDGTGSKNAAELRKALSKLDTFELSDGEGTGGRKMLDRAKELYAEELDGKDFNSLSLEEKRELVEKVGKNLSADMGGYRSAALGLGDMRREFRAQGIGVSSDSMNADHLYFDDAEGMALAVRAIQQGGGQFSGLDLADAGALNYDSITAADAMVAEAGKGMKEAGFSDETREFLKGSKSAMKVAKAAASDPKVAQALRGSSAAGVKASLEKLGIQVSTEEAKGLMKFGAEFAKGTTSVAAAALDKFKLADDAAGMATYKSNVQEAGNALMDLKLGDAVPQELKDAVKQLGTKMGTVGSDPSSNLRADVMSSMEGVVDLAHKISGTKGLSREARDELAGSNKTLGALLAADEKLGGLTKGSGKRKFKTYEELQKVFGLSKEELEGAGIRFAETGESRQLTAEQSASLRKVVEGRIAGHLGGKDAYGGAKDVSKTLDSLDTTLKGIDNTMKLGNTIQLAIANKLQADVGENTKNAVAGGPKETTPPKTE